MGSTGVANTIDLSTGRGFKYALDGIWKLPFGQALYVVCAGVAIVAIVALLLKKMTAKQTGIYVGVAAALCLLYQIPAVANIFSMVNVPMVTFLIVGLLCLFKCYPVCVNLYLQAFCLFAVLVKAILFL